jgi:L-threonylcarbamoyladenylate synthase
VTEWSGGACVAELDDAAEALSRGNLVVMPTDTVYGLAARPDLAGATAKVFEAKERPRDLTLPVLAASVAEAATVGEMDHRARALAGRFWPGPLTIVAPRTDRARRWDLGEERETVGVRLPDHLTALALLRITGPLAVTSANISGQPTPVDCDGVRLALGAPVAVYLCAGRCDGAPSTVVDLTGPRPVVTRPGAISEGDILEAVGR